jgi:hypothetical protein
MSNHGAPAIDVINAAVRSMSKSAARVVSPEEYGGVPGSQTRDSVAPIKAPDKGIDINAMLPYMAAIGSGLLAYNASGAMVGDGEDKDSAWKKILKKLIPLGIGAAGAYGGYRLGQNLSKSAQDNRFSIGGKVVEFDDPAAIRGGKRLFEGYSNPLDPENIGEESNKGNIRAAIEGVLGGGSGWAGFRALTGPSKGPGKSVLDMQKQVDDAFKKYTNSVGKGESLKKQENLRQIFEELKSGKLSPRITRGPAGGRVYKGPSLDKLKKIDWAKRIARRIGGGALGLGASALLISDALKNLGRGSDARKFIRQWNEAR